MTQPWVWFDFENTPHVLFLEPILRRLQGEGWATRATARRQGHTVELAARHQMTVDPIGKGDMESTAGKAIGVTWRSLSLGGWVLRHGRPRLLVSCSRSASLVAFGLRIPAIALLDYEHAELSVLAVANQAIWFPDLLREHVFPRRVQRVAAFYPGLKENLYLDERSLARSSERQRLGVGTEEFLVVSRPPAQYAHYAKRDSTVIWLRLMRHLSDRRGTRILVISRTDKQREILAGELSQARRVEFLTSVTDGPALIAAADLVVCGGGTMNREAAVLGVPTWSVFTGPTPCIDDQLAAEGRLRWVRTEAEFGAATSAAVPAPLPPRGPFPAGLSTIMGDVFARLAPRGG